MKNKKRAIHKDQKQERWVQILDTAFALFQQKPYEQISMDQLASKMRLAKGTLYLYFHGKEDLFLALKLREYEKWFHEINKNIQRDLLTTPEDQRTKHFISLIIQTLKQRTDMIRLIASLHHILERNIEIDTIVNFHRTLGGYLLKTGDLLESYLPYLNKGQGLKLLMQIKAMAIGMSHVVEPTPFFKKAFKTEEASLSVFQMNFTEELSRMMSILLKGYINQSHQN